MTDDRHIAWRQSSTTAERPELVLYYREGCHLCEDMHQQLYELLPPQSFHLSLIDIDEDPELREAYHVRVPVLSLRTDRPFDSAACPDPQADRTSPEPAELIELCEHFLDLVAVTEALASYNRGLLAACSSPAGR